MMTMLYMFYLIRYHKNSRCKSKEKNSSLDYLFFFSSSHLDLLNADDDDDDDDSLKIMDIFNDRLYHNAVSKKKEIAIE